MGRLISTLFTLGIGIIIGIMLPKDSLNNLHLSDLKLPKLESFKPVEKNTIAISETKPAPITQKKSPPRVITVPSTEKVSMLPPVPPAPKSNLYTVQIASFNNRRQAEKYVKEANNEQIDAYIAPTDLNQNAETFRIFVGEYTNRDDALAKQKSLQSRFKGAFLQHF